MALGAQAVSEPRETLLRAGDKGLRSSDNPGQGPLTAAFDPPATLPPPHRLPIFSAMMFQRAMFWTSPDPAADESLLRRRFWRKCKRVASQLPFARELLAAYYCAFDRNTPLLVKATLIVAIAYFVLPTDAVLDFLPVLGFADDAASLAAA